MKYVQFFGEPNLLYRVLREKGRYILIAEPLSGETIWERKEYVEKVFEVPYEDK